MGLAMDLILYAILLLVFILRKEKGKRVSMLIGVIYASIACIVYLETNKALLITNIAIGLLCVALLFFTEHKWKRELRKPKKKVPAGLLGLFLGSFGSHWFYLGHWAWACLYLLFWWTYIPTFIGMAEAIIIFILPKNLFQKIYCNRHRTSDDTEPQQEPVAETAEHVKPSNESNSYAETVSVKDEKALEPKEYVEYNNVRLHGTANLCFAHLDGKIDNFTIKIETKNCGDIHFQVKDGLITSHYIKRTGIFREYEVN